jgi:phosphatidylserine/phosphatidylglycerophosphate/cardiolipin synthase-like enzyme
MVPRYPQVQSEFPQQEPDPYEESELVIPLDSGEKPRLCVHSKFFVIDDHITFIGSHNFDPRGNNLNTENGVLIWDDALALRVRQIFERDTAPQNSWVVAWRPKMPVVGHVSDSIAAISAALPFFDVWPFYYSSNYELIEGKEPVPVSHPDFYDHYEAVGPFPMMGLTPDQLGVRFIRAFGGSFARGLM